MAITKNKKSQFFLMSLVLVYLAIIVIFTYIRSADYTSVSLFDKNTKLELDNVIEQLKTRNNWLPVKGPTYWMAGMELQKRRLITINWLAAPIPNYNIQVDAGFTASDFADCSDNFCCIREIRMFKNATRLAIYSDTTAPEPPCSLVWTVNNLATGKHYYYIYYQNPIGDDPADGRAGGASGNSPGATYSVTVGPAEDSPAFSYCSHLANIYPAMGIDFNCTSTITTTGIVNRTNMTAVFTATDLKFNGSMI